MNKVYIVTEVCDDEYGNSAVTAVFSNLESANKYIEENQYYINTWFDSKLRALKLECWDISS